MNNTVQHAQVEMASDAARWRHLVMLLQRKAYKATITPEEIAAELPDLREIYRAMRFNLPDFSEDKKH